MNNIRQHEHIICRTIQILLLTIVIIRLIGVYKKTEFWDLNIYIHTAEQVMNGILPYDMNLYKLFSEYPPIQSPAVSLVLMPLLWIPQNYLCNLYFCGTIIAFFAYVIMVFHYYGHSPKDYLKAKWHNIPLWLILLFIFISSPFLTTLWFGQNGCFVVLCLFGVLFYTDQDKICNIFLLAFAAALKYSLLTFLVPVLVFQKRLRMSILAFILFCIMVLSVGLWLNGILPTFLEYIRMLIEDTQNGPNSYRNPNCSYLFIGFFKINALNILLKLMTIVLYGVVLLRSWYRGKMSGKGFPMRLSATTWGLFASMTLFISYHRVQDGILFMPFLGIIFIELLLKIYQNKYNKRTIIEAVIVFCYIVFWTLPNSLIRYFGAVLGKYVMMGEKLFIYSNYNDDNLFPLLGIVMFSMICFLAWLEFTQPSTSQEKMIE